MLSYLFGKADALLMREIEATSGEPPPKPTPVIQSETFWSLKLPGFKATLDENDNLTIEKATGPTAKSLTLDAHEAQHLSQWLSGLIEPPTAPQKQTKGGSNE